MNPRNKDSETLRNKLEFKREKYLKPIQEKQALIGNWGNDYQLSVTVNIDDNGRLWSKVVTKYTLNTTNDTDEKEETLYYWDENPLSLSCTKKENILFCNQEYKCKATIQRTFEITYTFINGILEEKRTELWWIESDNPNARKALTSVPTTKENLKKFPR